MDILIHWRDLAGDTFPVHCDDVEAITCDGRIVTVVQLDDTIKFPLNRVAEFQVLDETV